MTIRGSLLALLLMVSTVFATTVPLYHQASDKAKVIREVNLAQGIIPILFSKDWLKVALPTTGEVGWIKRRLVQPLKPAVVRQVPADINYHDGRHVKRFVAKVDDTILSVATKPERIDKLMKLFKMQQTLLNQQMQKNARDRRRFNELMLLQQGAGQKLFN